MRQVKRRNGESFASFPSLHSLLYSLFIPYSVTEYKERKGKERGKEREGKREAPMKDE